MSNEERPEGFEPSGPCVASTYQGETGGRRVYVPCGVRAPLVVDPFLEEICNEIHWRYLCDRHCNLKRGPAM